ncbi:hypothetical protein B0H10DRAFT_2195931 [Mycena sp. CBHHK59/15]|nr:hypothetical protein B0H10DRAFT_2195931 [Mycena sp. CBHHK59/15]
MGGPTVPLLPNWCASYRVDICLGLDWKAMMREWLIGLGQPPALYLSYLHARDPSDVSGCITPFLSLVNLSATSTRGQDVSLHPGSDVSTSPTPSCYTRSSTASIPASMIAGPDHCVSCPNLTAYAHTTHSNVYAHSPVFAPVHNTTTNMLAHHCNSVPVTSAVIQGTSSNGFGPPWSFLLWSDSFRGSRGPGFPFDDWIMTGDNPHGCKCITAGKCHDPWESPMFKFERNEKFSPWLTHYSLAVVSLRAGSGKLGEPEAELTGVVEKIRKPQGYKVEVIAE